MEKIQYFIKMVEAILEIKCVFNFDDEEDLSEHALAGAIEGTTTIIISKRLLSYVAAGRMLEFILVVTHEMRHVYQFLHNMYQNELDRYENRDNYAYQSQLCEIDANAFAYLVVYYFIGKSPSKRSWQTDTFESIVKHANKLVPWFNQRVMDKKVNKYLHLARKQLGI